MRNLGIVLLIGIVAILLGWMIYGAEEESVLYSMDDARSVAEEWVKDDSLTYAFDGSDLELVNERELENNTFEFAFDFQSASAGFGDRTDQMTAQVITSHTVVVVVDSGEVVSAITDGVYSEIDGEMVTEGDADSPAVSVYFISVEDGQEEMAEVQRTVSGDGRIEIQALKELLSGPTEEESGLGYSTAINEGVEINDFSIQTGTAIVDFSADLSEGIAGSATVMAIRDQIERTLEQFNTVENVVIKVDGKAEGVLQP